MESCTRNDDIVLITEIKQSILNLFTSSSKIQSVTKNNSSKCKLCLNTIPTAQSHGNEKGCLLESDLVGVVMQCLLVPSIPLLDKNTMLCIPIICKECNNELTKLVDLFLQLEEIRKEFESMRHKVAKQVIRTSLGKSERHFQSWKNEAEFAKNVYPSEIELKNIAESNGAKDLKRSKEGLSAIPTGSCADYSCKVDYSPVNQKVAKTDQQDRKLTQMSCVVVLERIDDPNFPNQNAKSTKHLCKSNGIESRNLNLSPTNCDSDSLENNLDTDNGSSDSQTDIESVSPSLSVVTSDLNVPTECANVKEETEDDQDDFDILLEATADSSFTEIRGNEFAVQVTQNISCVAEDQAQNEDKKLFSEDFYIEVEEMDGDFNQPISSEIRNPESVNEGNSSKIQSQETQSESELTARDLRKRKRDCLTNESYSEPDEDNHDADFVPSDFSDSDDTDSDYNIDEAENIETQQPEKESNEKVTMPAVSKPTARKRFSRKKVKTDNETGAKANKQYSCIMCKPTATFTGSAILRRHLWVVHQVPFWEPSKKPQIIKSDDIPVEKPPKKKRQRPGYQKSCDICGLKLKSRTEAVVVRHKAIEHGIFPVFKKINLNCKYCELAFTHEKDLIQHKLQLHSAGTKHRGSQCDICLKFILSQTPHKLILHKRRAHDIKSDEGLSKSYKCFLCPNAVEYLNRSGLREHEKSKEHKEEVKSRISVFCNTCRMNFNGSVEALKDHLKGEEHKKEVEGLGKFDGNKFCIPCRQHFDTTEELKKHEIIGVGHRNICNKFREIKSSEEEKAEGPLICHACPKVFNVRSILDRHVQKCHPPLGHVCKICNLQLSTYENLVIHKRSHASKDSFVCHICGAKLTSQGGLQAHVQGYHGEEMKCDECGLTCPSKQKLLAHIRQKHPVDKPKTLKVHECPHCEKTFHAKYHVAFRKHLCLEHPEEHLKDSPHPCIVCYHTFATEDELNVHLETHAYLKCTICDKYSMNIGHLQSHMRIHTGERPFKCTLCDQSFKTNGHLSQHVNGVHKDKKRLKTVPESDDSNSSSSEEKV